MTFSSKKSRALCARALNEKVTDDSFTGYSAHESIVLPLRHQIDLTKKNNY